MQKKEQSIWTKDITPHVVNVMTMDITPDFTSELWTKDITHHMVATLAVFGLLVSSLVAIAGVATVGVNVEVAFAQQASTASQTAALAMGDMQPASAAPMPNVPPPPVATSTPGRPPMDPAMHTPMASSTMGMASSSSMFCPKLERTVNRGANDATTTGDVGQLQQFMANHFGLDPRDLVTGHFGSTTLGLVQRFQQEQGLGTSTGAGPLTRAAIGRLCGQMGAMQGMGKPAGDNHQMGSTSPMMGSSTPSMPPMRHDDMRQAPTMPATPPMPPKATTTMPVSYYDSGSNSAAALEAINEISDGYGKLFGAALGLVGL